MIMTILGRRRWLPVFILAVLATTFLLTVLFYNLLQYSDKLQPSNDSREGTILKNGQESRRDKLGVIVPFRDRFDELMMFVPHMEKYLSTKKINHEIFIINQADTYRFNRASLINVGFLLAKQNGCTYIAMHDVDLLPENIDLPYTFPREGPMHVAAPNLHPLYHYEKYIGGILLISIEHFELVNGMTNIFWGWGREDDELYVRLKQAKLSISRPVGIETGLHTFRHLHDRTRRKRDYSLYYNQKQLTKRRDYATGLNTIRYDLVSQRRLAVDGATCTVYNVRLHCDLNVTPYCLEPQPTKRPAKKKS